tara:strand:+ start:254 stop:580 length:327 start_codon:yes stop_codon:yes gene_type:complete
MADTYTWSIATLDRTIATGFVDTVHWNVSASRPNGDEDAYSAYNYGSVGLEGSAGESGFIDYDDLTETTCIGWVKDSLGDEAIAATEAALSALLDAQQTPTKAEGVPW